MTNEELEAEFIAWNERVIQSIQEDRDSQARARKVWRERLDTLVACGAKCLSTAIRWDMQAYGADSVEQYCFEVFGDVTYELVGGVETMMRAMTELEAA